MKIKIETKRWMEPNKDELVTIFLVRNQYGTASNTND